MLSAADLVLSRQVTYKEFERGLKAAGLSIDTDDLELMFQRADLDNSGSMDFYEFRSAYTQHG